MPGTGIWLDDDAFRQSAGQIWLQQQHQRVQAGQDWAQQQIQQAMRSVQAMVPPAAPPAQPEAPVTTGAPPPVATPTPAPAPTPTPIAPPPEAAPPPPAAETPPPAPPPAAPPPTPVPQPQTQTPTQTTDLTNAGADWANQQIQNLLGGAANAAQATPPPPPPPGPAPSPAAPPPAQAGPAPSGGVDSSSPSNFARSFAPYAQYAAQQLGVDPTWVTAMAGSESNYGKAAGNELFGIKALPGQAGTTMMTHEGEYGGTNVNQTFASYDSPMAATQSFVNLIKNHYPGAVNAPDLGTFVHGLKQGGYFTAAEPEYRGILQGISDRVGGAVQDALQGGQQAVGGAVQGAQNAVQNVAQQGLSAVNTAVDAAKSQIATRASQFGLGLSSGDAMAFCGPTAAIAFAQTYGRNPSVDEAKQLAQQVGWNAAQGMAGVGSEVKLLQAMGVDAHATQGVDWSQVGRDASGGNPVIIDTPGHYYYVDGYNAQTGQMHVGTSGTDLKGGAEWMTPDQINAMPQSHGAARSAVFADHPLAQQDGLAQSVGDAIGTVSRVGQLTSPLGIASLGAQAGQALNPAGAGPLLDQSRQLAGNILGGAASGVQGKVNDITRAVLDIGGTPPSSVPSVQDQLQQTAQQIQQVPQSVGDLLSQNAMTAAGIPNVAGKALQDAGTGLGDWWQREGELAAQYPDLASQFQPLDLTRPLGPQLGFDPYGQIVQQGIPQLVGGIQRGNVGDVLGGGLQTLLGAASALPGTGGAAEAAGAEVPALLRNLPSVAQVPWSEQSLALLRQGPQELPLSAIPWSDRSLALLAQGPGADLAPAAYSPRGVLIDPLTRQEMVPRGVSQYGPHGVAIDPVTGQEMLPATPVPSIANSYAAAVAANPEATQFVRTAGNQFEPVVAPEPQAAGDVLTGLRNMLSGRQGTGGGPFGGRQEAAINAAFARALGGGAAGGLGAYETTDPNDPNRWLKVAGGAGLGALAGGPGVDIAAGVPRAVGAARAAGAAAGLTPPSLGDWLGGLYKGGVISGLNTMADVAFNATLSPMLSGVTGAARDLATFQPGRLQGRVLGAQSGLVNWTDNFLQGLSDSLARPSSLSARAGGGLPGVLANVFEGAGALHGAFQNATSQLIQAMEHGAASGEAASAAGHSGPAWFTEFQRQFAQPVSAEVQAMGDRAAARGDLGTLTSAFGKFVNQAGPVGDALFPVYRMGMALGSRMVEASPLGLAGTAADVALKAPLSKGPYADILANAYKGAGGGLSGLRAAMGATPAGSAVGPLSERLTNNLIGTALSVWLASKATSGTITGSGPTDPGERRVWLGDGNQPNSFLAPDGAYHSWEKLPPQLKGPMMAAGAYADAVQAYNKQVVKQASAGPQAYGVEDPRVSAAAQLVSEVGEQLASATPMRTMANLYDALQSGGVAGTALRGATDTASSILGGLVPESGLVRSVAQMTDPLQRQALQAQTSQQLPQSIAENVMQNIPVLRENLPARLDVLGRQIGNPLQGAGEVLPVRTAPGTPTPILAAMQHADVTPTATPDKIAYGPMREIALRPDERQAYERYRGAIIQRSAGPLVGSDRWQQMSSFSQHQALSTIDQAASTAAQQMVLRDIVRTGDAAGRANWVTGSALAPVVGYSPDVLGNQLSMQQQLQTLQHRALMQSLLGA